MIGGPRRIKAATVQAASDRAGIQQLLAALGYDTSEPTEQTAASLGVAERSQHLIRNVCRVAAERLSPGLPPALEIYFFEVTALTVELRKALVAAFRNKPANVLLIVATRDFSPLDFVVVEKAVEAGGPGGARVAVSHRLMSVDRHHPSPVHIRVLERMSRAATDPFAQFERIRDAFRLAEWSEDEFNNRGLFSDYFLKSRLTDPRAFPVWNTDLRSVHRDLTKILAETGDVRQLGPKEMHANLIKPIMAALGFKAESQGKDDEADFLLRPADTAADSPAVAALLAYSWDRPLDRQDDLNRDRADHVPGIRVVGALEKHKTPWAILTNGKDWRLYCAEAHSRASNYYEVELPEALERDDLVALRYFWLFFRAGAFAPATGESATGEPQCFLDRVRLGSQSFAKEVGDRLRGRIFDEVFPYLAEGFVQYRRSQFDEKTDAGDEFLDHAYDATLTLLYRLLFLLYAESLDLLPVHEPAYAAASLTRLKVEVAAAAKEDANVVDEQLKRRYTKSDTGLWLRLSKLFQAIAEGSRELNVPAYNGGLFSMGPDRNDKSREATADRFLTKYRVPDYFLARALDLLAREEDPKNHELVFVDYRSLGVRQLGTIYEGLLIYHVVVPRDDWEKGFRRPNLRIALVPSNQQRKSTGSYFTPQHIVKYIVTNTVGPLLDEKFAAAAPKLREAQRWAAEKRKFEDNKAEKLRSKPPTDDQIALWMLDHPEPVVWELLDLKVLDPSMGSGHFLVETVDYITDRVLHFLAGFPTNPVQVVVDQRIRRQIMDALDQQEVKINEERLTDVNLIKRLVMKRCVYGVDLNPMAVELAKVSLWLDSFTLGAPLSFLDHHLKCGNSLIGATIDDLKRATSAQQSKTETVRRMFALPLEPLHRATRGMEMVADLTDATLSEVSRSAETYKNALVGVRGYRALLDCLTAEHFGVPGASELVSQGGDLDLEHWDATVKSLHAKDRRWIEQAEKTGRERAFFHWDVDFPDVFFTSRRPEELRRFDAVVGNPPWGADLDEGEIGYARQRFSWCGGQRDTYMEFTEQSHDELHAGGRYGMILPDAWLTGTKYEVFRRALLKSALPSSVVDLPYNTFPEAYVDCAILTTRRMSASDANDNPKIAIVRFANDATVPANVQRWPTSALSLSTWKESPGCEFVLLTEAEASIVRRFTTPKHKVSEILEVDRGLEAYGQNTPAEVRKRRGHHSSRALGKNWWPQLSGELRRYWLVEESVEYVNVGAELAECPPLSFFEGTRVLIRRLISRQYRLMAARSSSRFVVDSSTLLGCSRIGDVGCGAVIALVNSAFFSFCQVNKSNIALRNDYPKVSLYEARSWPLPEFEFLETSDAQTVSQIKRLKVPMSEFDASSLTPAIADGIVAQMNDGRDPRGSWPDGVFLLLGSLASCLAKLNDASQTSQAELRTRTAALTDLASFSGWTGATILDDIDYLGWEGRFPDWQPDEQSAEEGRWYPNGVSPPLDGDGPGEIPWELIARVYPSYPLPGIDMAAWELAAWDDLCDLLRKNKTKIGNTRIRADLTGSGPIAHPTGALRQLREAFLDHHRMIRAKRARAAELDFLIDRIVFRLFDLTLDEQRLILSRVGPGRPLPPRRGGKRKKARETSDGNPRLFDMD